MSFSRVLNKQMMPGSDPSLSCRLSFWSEVLFTALPRSRTSSTFICYTELWAVNSPLPLNQLQPSQHCRHPARPAAGLINSLVHLRSSVNKASNWCTEAAAPHSTHVPSSCWEAFPSPKLPAATSRQATRMHAPTGRDAATQNCLPLYPRNSMQSLMDQLGQGPTALLPIFPPQPWHHRDGAGQKVAGHFHGRYLGRITSGVLNQRQLISLQKPPSPLFFGLLGQGEGIPMNMFVWFALIGCCIT